VKLRLILPLLFLQYFALAGTAPSHADEAAARALELRRQADEDVRRGDFAGASVLLRDAEDAASAASPDLRIAISTDRADTLEHVGAWPEAIRVLNNGLGAAQAAFGPSDWRTAAMQVRLSSAEVVIGHFASAEARLRGALRAQQAAPVCHKSEVALALATLAIVDMNAGRLADAESDAYRAVEIAESVDPETVDVANMLGVLGGVYVSEGLSSRAYPLLTRSIDIFERKASASDVRLAPMLVGRGLISARESKFATAEQDIARAVAILDCAGAPCVNADWARLHLAQVYLQEQKLAEADAILPQTVERQRRFLGSGRRLAFCIRELARLRAMQKRWREARDLYRETLVNTGSGDAAKLASLDRHPANEKEVRHLEQQVRAALRPSAD